MNKIVSIIIIASLTFSISGCKNAITSVGNGVTASSGITNNSSSEQVIESIDSNSVASKVKVQKIAKEKIEDSISYIGTIKATSEINILARGQGIIKDIFFKDGDTVKANDVIIDISDPKGENATQINQELAKIGSNNAKTVYDNTIAKTKQTLLASQLALSTAEQNLTNATEQLNITKNQNEIIIKSSEIQLENSKNNLKRLQNTVDISKYQIGISDQNLIDSVNISLENSYNSLELILFSTLQSIFITLSSQTNLPNGLDNLEKDLKDLQDDLDDADKNDIYDLSDIAEDLQNYIVDLLEYINDEDFMNASPTLYSTIRATVEGIRSQTNSIQSGLVSSQNTLNSLSTNTELQTTNLNNQIEAITDQISLQELAVQSSKTQSNLAIHTINSSINNLKKSVENGKINIELTKIAVDSETNQAKAQYESSLLNEEQASLNTNYLKIKPNIEGKISEILVEKGQLISPGTPVAIIFQENKKEVEIYIDPKNLKDIPIGTDCIITFKEDNTEYKGKISEITSMADPSTHLVTGKISLTTYPIIFVPNSIVKVKLLLNIDDNFIYIPLKSVLVRESGNYVYIIDKGKTLKKEVEIGNILGSKIEILKGLSIGDTLIIDGHRGLDEGVNVEIIE